MTPTLLLVEDDPFTVELVRRALQKAGVDAEVVVEPSGEQALARLRLLVAAGTAPEAVLLDLRPLGTGGLEVLDAVRGVPGLDRCPVVVYTGSSSGADEEAARAAGADGFFIKPDEFGELVERMREIGTRWLGAAQVAQ